MASTSPFAEDAVESVVCGEVPEDAVAAVVFHLITAG
jgi:hypothetical protein